VKVARVAICRNAARAERDRGKPPEAETRWLRNEIMRQGLGLFASGEDRDRFLASLSDVERAKWVKLIVERRLAHVLGEGEVTRIDRHDCLEELRRTYCDHADLVLCGLAHARQLGLPAEEDARLRPEVASLGNVASVATLSYDESEAALVVPRGTSREQVWRERFAVPAQWVQQLAIVDRYGLQRHNAAGIVWLLRRLFRDRRDPGPVKLELAVERRSAEVSLRHVAEAIDQLGLSAPDPQRFRSIIVWVADQDFGQREMHERFLRFDGRVIDCGTGCAIFGEGSVFQRTSLSFGSYAESEELLGEVSRTCVGARWHSAARMWLSAEDASPIALVRRKRAT
jgi:hypothetical protein